MFYISCIYYAGITDSLLSVCFHRTVKSAVTNIFAKKKTDYFKAVICLGMCTYCTFIVLYCLRKKTLFSCLPFVLARSIAAYSAIRLSAEKSLSLDFFAIFTIMCRADVEVGFSVRSRSSFLSDERCAYCWSPMPKHNNKQPIYQQLKKKKNQIKNFEKYSS